MDFKIWSCDLEKRLIKPSFYVTTADSFRVLLVCFQFELVYYLLSTIVKNILVSNTERERKYKEALILRLVSIKVLKVLGSC